MPADTPVTLKQQEFSTVSLGLAAILFGYAGLIGTVAGEMVSLRPAAGLSFIATSVPLAFLFAGTGLLSSPDSTAAGRRLLWQIRFLGAGGLLLFPFVSWSLSASRNSYLTACALLALFCLSLLLQRVCEYLRVLYAARQAHVKSAWAHRVRQLTHFGLVTPCAVAAVILFTRQKTYDIKASQLAYIIWRHVALPVKIILTVVGVSVFFAVFGLMAHALFSLPPRLSGRLDNPKQ